MAKEVMGVATELLTSISQDEKERAIFRSRRMYISDLESNIRVAERRGEERGIAIGEVKLNERINTMALDMKKNKIPLNIISNITGLSIDFIEKM